MGLECQLIDMKSVANEDCVSLLPDIAETANEVIPVQHGASAVHAFPLVDSAHALSAFRYL
jgi:hypothetical protein